MADLLTPQLIEGLKTAFAVFAAPAPVSAAAPGAASPLVLGLAQLSSVLHALGIETTESEVYEVLSRADTQGRGFLDFAEFAQLMTGELKDTIIEADLADAFAAIDKDGDKNGSLQAGEIENEIATVRPEGTGAGYDVPLTRQDVEGLIAEIAGPGARGVTLAQFSAAMRASL
jgi:Ca2+-binding EF-hand superfamily protein